MLRAPIVAVLVGVMAVVGAPPSSAASPAVASMGTWSLARLGYHDLELGGARTEIHVQVGLPAGAAQGPESWWQLYLHVRISFRPDARGRAYLTASMDGAASASIKFDFDRGPPGGMLWNTVDVNGEINHSAAGHAAEFDFSNYVQKDGIHPGAVALSFAVESFTGSAADLLDSATISAARSGLVWNTDGPYDLGLSVGKFPQTGHVGDEVTIPYTLTNADAAAARGLSLDVGTTAGLHVVGRSPLPVPPIARQVHGTVRVTMTGAGDQQVLLRVLTDGHRARAAKVLSLSVADEPDHTFVYVLIGIAVALFALGAFFVFGRPRGR